MERMTSNQARANKFIISLDYDRAYRIHESIFDEVWDMMEKNNNPIFSLKLTDECGVMKVMRRPGEFHKKMLNKR